MLNMNEKSRIKTRIQQLDKEAYELLHPKRIDLGLYMEKMELILAYRDLLDGNQTPEQAYMIDSDENNLMVLGEKNADS